VTSDVCVDCGKMPVFNKKRSLCSSCYTRAYRRGSFVTPNGERSDLLKVNSMHKREMEFIRNYFTHTDWYYEPCTFCLGEHKYIVPDFYDGKRNSFIEVIGSRQRYHINKGKYKLFKEMFPEIRFSLRMPDATVFNPDNPRWKEHGAYPSKEPALKTGVDK